MNTRILSSRALRAALAYSASALAIAFGPAAFAQETPDQVQILRVASEIADGKQILSTSSDILMARHRTGDQSMLVYDAQNGVVVVERDGQSVAAPLSSRRGPEVSFAYNYKTGRVSGDKGTAAVFNTWMRPLAASTSPTGANANWMVTTDLRALGMFKAGAAPLELKLKRSSQQVDGQPVVLLEFDIPAFQYHAPGGETVIHWARGFAVVDADYSQIFASGTQHRASAIAADGAMRPISVRNTMHGIDAQGAWSMRFEGAPAIRAAFERVADVSGEKAHTVAADPNVAGVDPFPAMLADYLDMAAFALAEGGANPVPLGAGVGTSASQMLEAMGLPVNTASTTAIEALGLDPTRSLDPATLAAMREYLVNTPSNMPAPPAIDSTGSVSSGARANATAMLQAMGLPPNAQSLDPATLAAMREYLANNPSNMPAPPNVDSTGSVASGARTSATAMLQAMGLPPNAQSLDPATLAAMREYLANNPSNMPAPPNVDSTGSVASGARVNAAAMLEALQLPTPDASTAALRALGVDPAKTFDPATLQLLREYAANPTNMPTPPAGDRTGSVASGSRVTATAMLDALGFSPNQTVDAAAFQAMMVYLANNKSTMPPPPGSGPDLGSKPYELPFKVGANGELYLDAPTTPLTPEQAAIREAALRQQQQVMAMLKDLAKSASEATNPTTPNLNGQQRQALLDAITDAARQLSEQPNYLVAPRLQDPDAPGYTSLPDWIRPDSADVADYQRLVDQMKRTADELRKQLDDKSSKKTNTEAETTGGLADNDDFYTNNAFDYSRMVGTVPTDLSRWAQWLATQNVRELERYAALAGYPNLASALADASNLIRQSQDPGYRRWAMQAPSCNGLAGCGPSYLERWWMKQSVVALGDILAQSRDIFSTGGFSDIGISGLNLNYLLRDHSLEDGDIVQVKITQFGRTIYQGQVNLTNLGEVFNQQLGRGVASLEIFAVNEGYSPPNTAQVRIDNVVRGQGTQTYSLRTGETATLRIEAGAAAGAPGGTP